MISAEKLHLACYLSIGLLSLSLLAECDKIRLVGPHRCSGRVEVYYNDKWGTVCDDRWTLANADVVCRELNCGTALAAKGGAFFGEGKDDIWLDDVQCTGHEMSITKCEHRPFGSNNCGHSEDAGVICSEHVKVVNGSSRCNGRVEIYRDGQWKRACNNDWSKNEENVVCREINCGIAATEASTMHFGEVAVAGGVKTTCTGNETTISGCVTEEITDNCVDATVVCTNSNPIRLKNGTSPCSGRVEIFRDGIWGTICDDKWGMQEAAVVCRQMNCGTALQVKYKAYFGRGQDRVWMDDLECTGSEKSLTDCPHRGFGDNDCDHNEDAGVICSDAVRLNNGTDRCSGRVEVLRNGQWGKICKNQWGLQEAGVVCAELNCGSPKAIQDNFYYGDSELRGYTSRCIGNVSSIAQCSLQEISGTCEGASLACAGNPPLRLANGTNRCSGRVEILHNDQWGTVCDDEWDIRDAQVVCRAMDCGSAQMAKRSAYFGQGEGDIWLDDVKCVGNESSLLHCQHPNLGENNCGHSEDAGVVCSASIRLSNGSNECSGRVEFYHNNQWVPAVNVFWGTNELAVVCREMNCGDPVKSSGVLVQARNRRGYRVGCNGRESSLSQCTLTEYGSNDRIEDVVVECSGNVRLASGHSRCVGRVEFFNKGQWGTVCGEYWDTNDASVVCQQMGCGKVHKITTHEEYGRGTQQVSIDQLECNGQEMNLAQCNQRAFIDKTCNVTSIAGVVCSGSLEVRLAQGKDECSGRLEVRHGEAWSTVCDADWNLSKAQVVCDLLECGNALDSTNTVVNGQGSGTVVQASDSCFLNETNLRQCSINGYQSSSCRHDRDVVVACAAQIRLVGGTGQCSGRVEVFYKGQWGTVCDDEWGMSNGDVTCRQIGCGHAVSAPSSAHFGRGSGPIWLDNVDCSGQESALAHCAHNAVGDNNCGHGEDAGVICLGALEKPQITISPGTDVNWGDRVEITCSVVTEHLGGTFVLKRAHSTFKMQKYSESEVATFILPKADFNLRGSYFCEYQKKLSNQVVNYPQGNVADLTIEVKLETPRISLSSPYAMVVYTPDEISVNRGSSFSVVCSTVSKYPGGYFYLARSNKNISEAQPAYGHSIFYRATFDFPAIEYKHQGAYTCIFGINISSTPFCSDPSKSLQVIVTATSATSPLSGGLIALVVLLLAMIVGYFVWKRRSRVTGAMVQFSNRLGGSIKHDFEERSNGLFDGRDYSTRRIDVGIRPVVVEKKADVDIDNAAERDPEDLAGRVCYELEPLVLS